MSRVPFRHISQAMSAVSADNPVRILFVDDDQGLLDGLRRSLRGMRKVWTMTFINGGPAALELLDKEAFDVVISDLSMPGIDGFQVLEAVKKRLPGCIRIILSGNADVSSVIRTIGPAHQFLSKPCDSDALKDVIDRALNLRRLLSNENLTQLVGKIDSLPSIPEVYEDLQEALCSDQVDLHCIGTIVKRDVALTGKVLKLVNSAFFGMKRTIYDPGEAACILGMETLKSLMLATHSFETLSTMLPNFHLEELWAHSLNVAAMTKAIAMHEKLADHELDAAYLAGLMHDAGRLVLAKAMLETYDKICAAVGDGPRLTEVERKIMQADHGEVGAYMLGLWGCADLVIEAIAYHHRPSAATTKGFSLALAVHFADAMDMKIRRGHSLNDHLEVDFIKDPEHMAMLAEWRTICHRTVEELETSNE